MPTKILVNSVRVEGPAGQRLHVVFYGDGSIALRIAKGGPMVITEAYLQGAGKDVIVELSPAP